MVQIVGAQMTSQESKAELTQEANTTTGEMADKTAQIWLNFRRYTGPGADLNEQEMKVSDGDRAASHRR